MGGVTSTQSQLSQQNILNDIYQEANTMCSIEPEQRIEKTTIVAVGLKGNITLKNSLNIEKADCNLSASIDSTIENVLKSALDQKALTIPDFFSATNNKINQYMTINQVMKNNLHQVSTATCNIGGIQDIDNSYIFSQDQQGDIVLQNDQNLNNSSCVVSNTIKSITNNTGDAKGSQSATSIGGLTLFLIVIGIVGVIIAGIIIFIRTGGLKSGAAAQ